MKFLSFDIFTKFSNFAWSSVSTILKNSSSALHRFQHLFTKHPVIYYMLISFHYSDLNSDSIDINL